MEKRVGALIHYGVLMSMLIAMLVIGDDESAIKRMIAQLPKETDSV